MTIAPLTPGDRSIGVDVEALDTAACAAEVSRYFQRAEAAVIDGAPNAERLRRFVRIWTRKEAVLKADGRGLLVPLDTICVLAPCTANWCIVDLRLPETHLAALAYDREGPALSVRLRPWPLR